MLGADEPKGTPAKEELAKFQGTWQLISAEKEGKQAPEERVNSIRVTIKDNTHTVRIGEEVVAHDVSFVIDPSKSPKETTDTINEGPDKGKEILGIYRLEEDTLISCVAPVGKPRPTKFAAKAGSGSTLRIFRRVKPGKAVDPSAIKDELRKFEGTWSFESMEAEGQKVPVDGLKGFKMTIKNDRFTMIGPDAAYKGVYDVNPTARPKTIDVTFTEGPEAGTTMHGIYELDGDTYKVCMAPAGKPRPKDFVSARGSGHVLEILKRDKP